MKDLSPAKAVNIISKAHDLSVDWARKILVAALAEGTISSAAESYWRSAYIAGSIVPTDAQFNASEYMIPADFWSLHHANNFDSTQGGRLPSGHWGDFAQARFRSSVCKSAAAAACCYPDFASLGSLGSEPVWLEWDAFGLTLDPLEIERLAAQSVAALRRPLRRMIEKPAFHIGKPTNDDVETLKARFAVYSLSLSDKLEIASSADKVKTSLKSIAANISEEAAISHKAIDRFARSVSQEAARLAARESKPKAK